MIKPFKITSVREEHDGARTVFFSITKVEQLTETKKKVEQFHAAVCVDAGLDIDEFLYDYLKKGGWIDA